MRGNPNTVLLSDHYPDRSFEECIKPSFFDNGDETLKCVNATSELAQHFTGDHICRYLTMRYCH